MSILDEDIQERNDKVLKEKYPLKYWLCSIKSWFCRLCR